MSASVRHAASVILHHLLTFLRRRSQETWRPVHSRDSIVSVLTWSVMSISAKHLAYAPIPLQGADDDGGDEGGLESPQHAALPQPHLRQYRRSSSLLARIVAGCVVVCICLLALVSSLIAWNFLGSLETKVNRYVASHRPVAPAEVCQSPVQRPSWNRLSRDARRAYIDAVLCLTKRPSRIFEQSSAYDDFTYMHIMYGNLSECSAKEI